MGLQDALGQSFGRSGRAKIHPRTGFELILGLHTAVHLHNVLTILSNFEGRNIDEVLASRLDAG